MSNSQRHIFLKFTLLVIMGLMISTCNEQSIPSAQVKEPNISDISLGASLSVSDENPGGANAGEGSSKLIDGDKFTKFLTFDYNPDFWAEQEFEEEVTINAYTVTAGNDAPERDPKNWTLQGSNDGSNWEPIDAVTDASFAVRNKTNIYRLDSEVTFQYFRLFITANAGETTLMQISEWRLLYYN